MFTSKVDITRGAQVLEENPSVEARQHYLWQVIITCFWGQNEMIMVLTARAITLYLLLHL